MDDQNNLNNPSQNPVNSMGQPPIDTNPQPSQENPTMDTVEIPQNQPQENQDMNAPAFTQMDSSTPPPPPIPTVEEFSDQNQGTNSPNLDIPPIISNENEPKKKIGGKAIVTILGVLVLLGGIGAGVFLLNQQQDLRSKAGAGCTSNSDCAYPMTCVSGSCLTSSGTTVVTKELCNDGVDNDKDGKTDCADSNCTLNADCKKPSSGSTTTTTKETKCVDGVDNDKDGKTDCTDPDCANSADCIECTTDPDCQPGYICSSNKCVTSSSGGTGSNASINCSIYNNYTEGGVAKATDYPSEAVAKACCPNQYYTKYSKWYCGTPSSSSGSSTTTTPSASCLAIKAYDTDWKLLTIDDLSKLTVDDKVRFTVAGTKTSGTFNKARFTINSILEPETTTLKPNSTSEFYIEYTIPTGIESFSVKAEIYHSTKGWI